MHWIDIEREGTMRARFRVLIVGSVLATALAAFTSGSPVAAQYTRPGCDPSGPGIVLPADPSSGTAVLIPSCPTIDPAAPPAPEDPAVPLPLLEEPLTTLP